MIEARQHTSKELSKFSLTQRGMRFAAPILAGTALAFSGSSQNHILYADNPSLNPDQVEMARVAPVFKTFANLDDGNPFCRKEGGKDDDFSSIWNTFSGDYYKQCGEQILDDIDKLSTQGVKAIRLWTTFPQFTTDLTTHEYLPEVNENIKNFDEVVDRADKNGMDLFLVLNSIHPCPDKNPFAFPYKVLTDIELQNKYIASMRAFLGHIKGNSRIKLISLINEESGLYYGSIPQCERYTSEQAQEFESRMYREAHAEDPTHSFAFSFDALTRELAYQVVFPYISAFAQHIDAWDLHSYGMTPQAVYEKVPFELLAGKPIIAGETGIYNKDGRDCEAPPEVNYRRRMAPPCDEMFLKNTREWLETTQEHGIAAVFFESWSSLANRFGPRIYDQKNKIIGVDWTPAARYIFEYNKNSQ